MPEPLYHSFSSLTDFLHFILMRKTKTTLVTCSSRDAFLQQLISERNSENLDSSSYHPGPRQLSDPSIQLIAALRLINLAFVPSLSHLRAYLSSYPPEIGSAEGDAPKNSDEDRPNSLVILNPLAAHRDSSEFSAQGLSKTFALAVETTIAHSISLEIVEIWEHGQVVPLDEVEGNSDVVRQRTDINPWKIHVPLLNESVRTLGDERVWAGKSIEVSKVIEQWFTAGSQP